MVLRCFYIDKDRLISVRWRTLMTAQNIRDRLETGKGPRGTAEFLMNDIDFFDRSHVADRCQS